MSCCGPEEQTRPRSASRYQNVVTPDRRRGKEKHKARHIDAPRSSPGVSHRSTPVSGRRQVDAELCAHKPSPTQQCSRPPEPSQEYCVKHLCPICFDHKDRGDEDCGNHAAPVKPFEEVILETWDALENHDEQRMVRRMANLDRLEAMMVQDLGQRVTRERSKSMSIANNYDGPHLPNDLDELTSGIVRRLTEHLDAGSVLHLTYARRLLEGARDVCLRRASVQRVEFKKKVTIVGDTHGNINDVFTIFSANGFPSPKNVYVFNGDFVDRGDNGCEVVLTLCAWMLLYPEAVWLNRGNHEDRKINIAYNFQREVQTKYNDEIFDLFQELFRSLPLCAVVAEAIFVVHGGLSRKGARLDLGQVEDIHRNSVIDYPKGSFAHQVWEDFTWGDPSSFDELSPNKSRGAGFLFGPKQTAAFLAKNGFSLLIRSHQLKPEGFEIIHNNRCVTLFSAANYCGAGNKGAYVVFTTNLEPEFHTFSSKKMLSSCSDLEATEKLQREVVDKLVLLIVYHRMDLYHAFEAIDGTADGMISVADWASAMQAVLDLHIDWDRLQPILIPAESTGEIRYVRFLERYRLEMTSSWSGDMMKTIMRRLYATASNADEIFSLIDVGNDGFVSSKEFYSFIKRLNLGLSDEQIYEFMREVDADMDNRISLQEFRDRFSLAFTSTTGDAWAEGVVEDIGERLAAKGLDLEATFLQWDTNGDGRISHSEFKEAVEEVGMAFNSDELRRLFATLDADNNGYVDVAEFTAAFSVVDASPQWNTNIIQRVNRTLHENADVLLHICERIDKAGTGRISHDKFVQAIESLNAMVDSPLSRSQIEQMATYFDDDGRIEYAKVLSGFVIVDSQTNLVHDASRSDYGNTGGGTDDGWASAAGGSSAGDPRGRVVSFPRSRPGPSTSTGSSSLDYEASSS